MKRVILLLTCISLSVVLNAQGPAKDYIPRSKAILDLLKAKEIQEHLKDIQITSEKINELNESDNEDDEDKGCAYEHIKGFIENVNFCVKNQLDMISVCH